MINGNDSSRQMVVPKEVALHYGLSNLNWDLDTDYLPVDVQNKIKCLYYDWFKDFDRSPASLTSLYCINDLGHFTAYPYINQLLDIIRSKYL